MVAKEEPRYVAFQPEDGPIDFGSPIDLDGNQYMAESVVYLKKRERPVGIIFLLGNPAQRMALVGDMYQRAIKLRTIHDELEGSTYRYVSLARAPGGMFSWSQLPVEYIDDETIALQEMPDELAKILGLPESHTPAYSVTQKWIASDGDPAHPMSMKAMPQSYKLKP